MDKSVVNKIISSMKAEEEAEEVKEFSGEVSEEDLQFYNQVMEKSNEADEFSGRPIEAAAESAAGAATFGLSNKIIKDLGIRSEEELRKIREYNQEAATLGTITGIVAPALIPGGQTGAAATAAKVLTSPARAAMGAGRLTEKAVRSALKSPKTSGAVKSIIQKGVEKGLGSTVEGAAFGVGQLMDEAAIGEADLNAENILSYGGLGALYGGAIGTALPVAGGSIAGAAKKTEKLFGKASSKFLNPVDDALDLLGATPSMKAFTATNKTEQRMAKQLPSWLKNNVGWSEKDSSQTMLDKLLKLGDESGAEIGRIMQQSDDAVLRMASDPAKKAELIILRNRLFNQAADSIEAKLKKQFGSFAKSNPIYKKIKKPLDALRAAARNTDDAMVANEVRQARNLISDAFTSLSREQKQSRGGMILSQAYGDFSEALERYVEFVNPGLKDQLRLANKNYHLYKKYKDPLARKVSKDGGILGFRDLIFGGVGYGVGAELGLAAAVARKVFNSDFKKKVVVLSNIEKANKSSKKMIEGTVESFISPSAKTIKLALVGGLLASDLSEDSKGRKAENKKQAFLNIKDRLDEMVSDPEVLNERIARSTSVLSLAAPNTAAQAAEALTRGVLFLNKKIPKPSYDVPFGRKDWEPSSMELAKFERYFEVVQNPLSVLEDLQNGTLTRDHVEALRQVYPSLYENIRFTTMQKLEDMEDGGKNLSYNKKILLGNLLDIPTDSSLIASNIAALQSRYLPNPEEQGQSQAGRPTKPPGAMSGSRTKALEQSSRMQTETQRVSSKED